MTDDTIAAVATAPGTGGVGIVRISGTAAAEVLMRVFRPAGARTAVSEPWKLLRGRVVGAQGAVLDDALAVFMPGPRTFTGEDVAELHCHGGVALLAAVLDEVCTAGARLAERGEFTRRAFLHGRMDLSQAEAVAELIAAPSRQGVRLAVGKLDGLLARRMETLRAELENLRAQLCVAVDFPDDEVDALDRDVFLRGIADVKRAVQTLLAGVERTRCWREGVAVALAGPVNAGKSSLMNALLGRQRAIVTATPGTTRDYLEESLSLAGLPARLVDTAGLRREATEDPVEAEGIRLGQERAAEADVVLLLVDGERGEVAPVPFAPERTVLVWNKADKVRPDAALHKDWFETPCAARVIISARTGEGVDVLAQTARETALSGLNAAEPDPDEVAPNARQARLLAGVSTALGELAVDVTAGLPYELCAVRLEEAAHALSEVVGLDSADDVLNRIFDTFCIGK